MIWNNPVDHPIDALEVAWTVSSLIGLIVWFFNWLDAKADKRALLKSKANGAGLLHAINNIRMARFFVIGLVVFTAIGFNALLEPAARNPTPTRYLVALALTIVNASISWLGIMDRRTRKRITVLSIQQAVGRDALRDAARDEGRDPTRDEHRDTARDLEHDKQVEEDGRSKT